MANCVFRDTVAKNGGAIYLWVESILLYNVMMINNIISSTYSILILYKISRFQYNDDFQVVNSIFNSNSAIDGGAIYL